MPDRKGERGEVTDEDLEWEYMVATAGPDTRTPWHTVKHDEDKPLKCWASGYYPDGSAHGCFDLATTDVGLCDDHYREVTGHAVPHPSE